MIMTKLISGLHHVTAMSADAQQNVDFYAGILGLRLVKKTVNFDAPEVYHLYYGNKKGSPGTILTFFPYPGIPEGRAGKGQLTVTAFSVAENALEYWMKRLTKFGIRFEGPSTRFNEAYIYFEDHEGLGLELVATSNDMRESYINGNIPPDFAIKGFYGITLTEETLSKTAELLKGQLDFTLLQEKEGRYRFTTSNKPGTFVDILCLPDALRGLPGCGTVHHVAFATADMNSQLKVSTLLERAGISTTPVIDREYFHSIYFREPGGVLFEVATDVPGFTIDEELDHLGENLKLPPWEEINRQELEEKLAPLKLDLARFTDDV